MHLSLILCFDAFLTRGRTRLADERLLNEVLVRAAAVTPGSVAPLVLGQLPVREARPRKMRVRWLASRVPSGSRASHPGFQVKGSFMFEAWGMLLKGRLEGLGILGQVDLLKIDVDSMPHDALLSALLTAGLGAKA